MKKTILLLFGLTILFFALRLPNLTLQPIFADEAIYVRWAQVMRAEPTLRFLPLSDGKTPLFMWMMIPLFKIFDDPLMAGRVLSVFSGYLTFLGVLFLGWRFFNRRVGILSAFLITVVPYFVFFDRLALVDSMLCAFGVWTLSVALLLLQKPRIDLAMCLGYLLGGSLLVKPPGMFNFVTLPLTLLAFDWGRHHRTQRLVRLVGLWLLAIFIGMVIYNILRLGSGFSNLSARNQDYVHDPSWIFQHPFDPLWPHLKDAWRTIPNMLTWPVFILSVVSAGMVIWKRNRTAVILLLWALAPLGAELALLQTFTARYLLFPMPFLIILAALVIDRLAAKKVLIAAVLLAIIPLYYDYLLVTDPAKAPLPAAERRGYLEDWTAGYGFPEIAAYLTERSKKEAVVVGTEGYFGTLPEGIQIYVNGNSNVIVKGEPSHVSDELRKTAKDHPTFYVVNKRRFVPNDNPLKLIKEYTKPTSENDPNDAILFFEVLP